MICKGSAKPASKSIESLLKQMEETSVRRRFQKISEEHRKIMCKGVELGWSANDIWRFLKANTDWAAHESTTRRLIMQEKERMNKG